MKNKLDHIKKLAKRTIILPIIEICGASLVSIGVFIINTPAGFIVTGTLIVIGIEASA